MISLLLFFIQYRLIENTQTYNQPVPCIYAIILFYAFDVYGLVFSAIVSYKFCISTLLSHLSWCTYI
jgi:hypothetical protein